MTSSPQSTARQELANWFKVSRNQGADFWNLQVDWDDYYSMGRLLSGLANEIDAQHITGFHLTDTRIQNVIGAIQRITQ